MKLRNAAYLAMFLHFARKTVRKLIPDIRQNDRRYLAIYPFTRESAIVGSFRTKGQAEKFRFLLKQHVRCQIEIECLDDWKGHAAYYKFKSVFDFTGNPDHWPDVPNFAATHGQSRETTEPTEANQVLMRHMMRNKYR